jgi:hypothetical protein
MARARFFVAHSQFIELKNVFFSPSSRVCF